MAIHDRQSALSTSGDRQELCLPPLELFRASVSPPGRVSSPAVRAIRRALTRYARFCKACWSPSAPPSPSGRDAQIVGYSFINSVLHIEDGQIVLGDGGRKGGYFAFRAEDSEQELDERLASSPEKKR